MGMIVGRQRLQAAQSYFQPLQLYQGGLILLSAFVLWQCGVMAGAKARARSALPWLSAFPFTSTQQSTHPPTHPPVYPSTRVLLIHPLTSVPIYHSSVYPSFLPSIHPGLSTKTYLWVKFSRLLMFDFQELRFSYELVPTHRKLPR